MLIPNAVQLFKLFFLTHFNTSFDISKMVQLLWKKVGRQVLKKLNIELPYDPAIPLLGINCVQFLHEIFHL